MKIHSEHYISIEKLEHTFLLIIDDKSIQITGVELLELKHALENVLFDKKEYNKWTT